MNTDQAKWGNCTSPKAQFPQVFAVAVSVKIRPQIRVIRGKQLQFSYSTPNLHTVRDRYVSPGRTIVFGNAAWFGESGKCCVSRHSPVRCA